MGFFSNLTSAIVKVALTPIAVVADAVNVATGQEANTTKDLLKSAGKDAEQAMDDATGN